MGSQENCDSRQWRRAIGRPSVRRLPIDSLVPQGNGRYKLRLRDVQLGLDLATLAGVARVTKLGPQFLDLGCLSWIFSAMSDWEICGSRVRIPSRALINFSSQWARSCQSVIVAQITAPRPCFPATRAKYVNFRTAEKASYYFSTIEGHGKGDPQGAGADIIGVNRSVWTTKSQQNPILDPLRLLRMGGSSAFFEIAFHIC